VDSIPSVSSVASIFTQVNHQRLISWVEVTMVFIVHSCKLVFQCTSPTRKSSIIFSNEYGDYSKFCRDANVLSVIPIISKGFIPAIRSSFPEEIVLISRVDLENNNNTPRSPFFYIMIQCSGVILSVHYF